MTKIRFLCSSFGNDEGDEVWVQHEEDDAFYYYDSFHRWCFVEKMDEGVQYEVVRDGNGSKWRCRA